MTNVRSASLSFASPLLFLQIGSTQGHNRGCADSGGVVVRKVSRLCAAPAAALVAASLVQLLLLL